MISVRGVHHVTLCCSAEQLDHVQDFYERVLGLTVGPRPSFSFSGRWLYAGAEPIVHLAAVMEKTLICLRPAASTLSAIPAMASVTGPLDHVALRMDGHVGDCRDFLMACGLSFSEAPVPGFPLYQIFLQDPLGVKIELNFALPS